MNLRGILEETFGPSPKMSAAEVRNWREAAVLLGASAASMWMLGWPWPALAVAMAGGTCWFFTRERE